MCFEDLYLKYSMHFMFLSSAFHVDESKSRSEVIKTMSIISNAFSKTANGNSLDKD